MTAVAQAGWLGSEGRDPVFAVHHPAAATGPAAASPVLIVPPWGWHEVASYRSRRTWAAHLAERGHATLRLDLPGTGDSAGAAASPDLVERWTAAVADGASWLAGRSGTGVTVIGLGLGGLIALRAIAAGAPANDLVLWATAATGREEIRRLRAFARLQPDRYALGRPEPVVLPDGWLEINGFVLSAQTVTAIGELTVPDLGGRLERALLLDADGLPVPAAIGDALRTAGVHVERADGPGWEVMTFHPQRDEPPRTVMAVVDRWLAAATPTRPAAPSLVNLEPSTRMPVDGGAVRETVLEVGEPPNRLFGVLVEPDSARPSRVAAVFLNAGAVRRIGPNRIWVEASRRWARLGVPTLRIDLDGIGDSDGDAARYRDVGEFYRRDEAATEIRAFSDALLERTGASHLILAGLCAGGFWAFHGADRDPRVTAAYLLNPGALSWRTDLVRRRDAGRLRRLATPGWWRRLLRGQVRAERVRRVATAAATEGWHRVREIAGHGVVSAGIVPATGHGSLALDLEPQRILDRLAERGTNLVIAFSDDEALYRELLEDGFIARLREVRSAHLEQLPGRDHTLRPAVVQRAAHELLDRSLAADLARLGIRSDAGAA